MKKTVLRTANTQSVNSLTDYLNTTTRFTGLNDSTNFTSVDQNSFSDCNNVFVNADDELSTRPPVIIQDFDAGTIKDIQQVNDLTFYVTTDYIIHWKHNDGWESIQCEAFEDIYITDYDDYYLIFTRNSVGTVSLAGLKYIFDSDTFETYTSEELIYIPFTTVYYGATVNDNAENKNLLTTAFRSQYIFSMGITTPSSSLDGEMVTIHLGDDEYTVIWDETIPQRFCKNIGVIRVSEDDSIIFDHVRMNDNGIYFAWFDYDKNDADHRYAMYSLDGNVWGKLTYPSAVSDTSYKVFTYTDNGLTVWLYEYTFENYVNETTGLRDKNPTTILYYLYLSTTVQNYTIWQSIEIDAFATTNRFMVAGPIEFASDGDYVLTFAGLTTDLISIDGFDSFLSAGSAYRARCITMHAAEDGEVVLIIPVQCNVTVYYRPVSSSAYVDSSGEFHDTIVTLEMTIPEDNIPDNTTITSYRETAMILVTCKDYAVVSSGLYQNPCAKNQSNVSGDDSNNQKMIVYYQPNDNLSAIFVGSYHKTSYFLPNFNSYLELRCYCIFVDENLVPYYNYTEELGMTFISVINGKDSVVGDQWLPQCCFELKTAESASLVYEYITSTNNAYVSNNIDGKFYLQLFYNGYLTDNSLFVDNLLLYSETNDLSISAEYNTYKSYLNATSIKIQSSKYSEYNSIYGEEFAEIIGDTTNTLIYSYGSGSSAWNLTGLSTYYASNKILTTTTDDSMSGVYIATCLYYYLDGQIYEYLDIYGSDVQTPINITTDGYITYATKDNKIYSNYFTDEWSVYYTEYGDTTLLMPFKVEDFITHTFMIDNLLYQSQSRTIEDDAGLLYIPENSKVVLPTQITESVVFSQTVLAVFTDTTAYEYTYDNDNDVYRLYPTKLQLGNREGYEICTAFDGLTIYMSTVFGYKSLTYESFVQSTEQAFTDCCAAINSIFNSYDDAPIKQAQYNYWIFLYKQTSNQMLVYDTRYDDTDYDNIRYPAWFKWTLPYNINKIWYEGRTFYLWLADNNIYTMEFGDTSIYDITAVGKLPITWFIRSQKLHFSYPAYYKHVSMLTSITLQNDIKLRYNLKFYNYRNAYDTEHVDTVEYPIETLGICNKRVNFMKTNAFQYEIRNDDTDQYPSRFVLSSIVIKFRVTEKIR